MSNSIWKIGDPVYRDNRFDEIIVREYKRWAADGVFYLVDDCTELPNRWAYLLDIIAQADKAERLQKAVDYAVRRFTELMNSFDEEDEVAIEIAATLFAIKQLIKG